MSNKEKVEEIQQIFMEFDKGLSPQYEEQYQDVVNKIREVLRK